MKKKVNVGIIGCGIIAPSHVSGYLKSGMANVVALCDKKTEKAKALAERFNLSGVKIYSDYEQLLQDPEIDAVSICTPHYLHAEMTTKAAEYKKHVLCEKPMAISLKQADEMIRACKKNGVKLEIVFQYRFTPDTRKIKEEFENGKFGIPIYGEAVVKWYREDSSYYYADETARSWRGKWSTEGGGALINQSIHTIDLLQWIMGPVDYLYAIYDTRTHNIEVEDLAVATLKFKNGALGTILGSVALRPQENWLGIYGSKKSVIVGSDLKIVKQWEEEGKSKVIDEVKEKEETLTPSVGHDGVIEDFLRSIVEDKTPYVTGEEGRKALEIVLAIYKAHKTGSKVSFPLVE
ncbi:MAG: Gfo/Idh/MocA family oxidoreductase [Thermoproteota archaeon]|nr:Gfo/Idh/MocA family oxidoreductase [Candidatus Brockarchaeota archaeon]MBO3801248.1 Gfo/Idh/MocA family oxidoreductase [Candidatus Brockarchaeota archaeon]